MGACVNRDDVTGPEPPQSGGSGPSRTSVIGLRVEVVFGKSRLSSVTHQATKALVGLLHACVAAANPVQRASEMERLEGRKRTWLSQTISALKALHSSEPAVLRDLVAPLVNVMLQAPDDEVRTSLWQSFVMVVVSTEAALAHLFYWAYKSAALSSEAERHTVELATFWRDQLAAMLLQKFSRANQGVKVSTLVDLLDDMRDVGEGIVQVRREQRNSALQRGLEALNGRLDHKCSVPIHILAPRLADRGARVISVLGSEAFVLASKERAPFQVPLEVELDDEQQHLQPERRKGFFFCCHRRAPTLKVEGKGAAMRKRAESGLEQVALHPLRTHSSPSLGLELRHQKDSRLMQSTYQLHEADGHNGEHMASKMRQSKAVRPKGLFKTESWEEVAARIRRKSRQGSLPNWAATSLILKSNADDVRQEELAYRLTMWFQRLFEKRKLKLWVMPFTIIATGPNSGCLETLPNAISIDALKKSYGEHWRSLRAYFEEVFPERPRGQNGHGGGVPFSEACSNFVYSMAGYSVISYVLAIRDRHNGNILLDDEGHVIHVDFGFMLCGAPGGKTLQKMGGFEHSQGFKLTNEYVDVMGGLGSPAFDAFREAFIDGLQAVRHEIADLLALLQLNMLGAENHMQRCFQHPLECPEAILDDIRDRLRLPSTILQTLDPDLTMKADSSEGLDDASFVDFALDLVDKSVDHWRSRLYDDYQRMHNGIL
eukprot:CAMPEP_0178372402 /NCGR_PEP_ID=MMETSP0689_2-20121128/1332_1 /TAXON_ID=160604 /ORGANISM="Amphidinium massartii, Strain CS-259" /LENGTH=714 /DNA_ID=CAMNT_0019992319 /DNA_START=433 /DNA_END=2577 /DNA_ORIENTATION=-